MTKVTCGLTAKKPGSATWPTLVIEYGTTLLYYTIDYSLLTYLVKIGFQSKADHPRVCV